MLPSYQNKIRSKTMTDQEFCKQQAKILEPIPQEFKSAISYHAYEQGHAYGNEEIIIHLSDLVDTLLQPIQEFEKRIRTEAYDKKQNVMIDATGDEYIA